MKLCDLAFFSGYPFFVIGDKLLPTSELVTDQREVKNLKYSYNADKTWNFELEGEKDECYIIPF